ESCRKIGRRREARLVRNVIDRHILLEQHLGFAKTAGGNIIVDATIQERFYFAVQLNAGDSELFTDEIHIEATVRDVLFYQCGQLIKKPPVSKCCRVTWLEFDDIAAEMVMQ